MLKNVNEAECDSFLLDYVGVMSCYVAPRQNCKQSLTHKQPGY
jgi:hypothetical protein